MVLGNVIAGRFNPLDSFNDLVTPVSIQVSERYQALLQDYCIQKTEDFLQGQIYLAIIVGLLILLSATSRGMKRSHGASMTNHHLMKLTSGKMVATEHEANLSLAPNQFHFSPNSGRRAPDDGKILIVSLLDALIYGASIIIHIYGHNVSNRDLILSVTLVLIAFVTLIGIFLPILNQIDRRESLPGSLTKQVAKGSHPNGLELQPGSRSSAFVMFPEFLSDVQRRTSADSNCGSSSGSRKPFAGTTESRRNMKFTLANLEPSPDSLSAMGFYEPDVREALEAQRLNGHEVVEKEIDERPGMDTFEVKRCNIQAQARDRNSKLNERRLIMLDVDPCCPKHGVAAWPKLNHEDNRQVPRTRSKDKTRLDQ